MVLSEAEKHDLYQGLVEKLGQRRAETFMNLVTTVPWSEVATKSDLERFATKADVERMGRKISMWTAGLNIALVALAFAAARLG